MARIAKSLDVLRSQINAKYPNRSKVSDGWIGDTAHAARPSDHNPGADGVVEALDITHDPANGPDTWKLAEILRQNKDRRIDYVISNGRVFVGLHGKWNGVNVGPWNWVKYTGTNSHAQHIHVSVDPSPSIYDSQESWALTPLSATAPAPEPPKPKGITADMRQRMMKIIMGYEGKIPPTIFIAPDGRPEIAGITQKDHPLKFEELKRLHDMGLKDKLQSEVIKYYLEYTAPAQNWTDRAGVEFFLRDCILNRGPTGAADILQRAVRVPVDHQVGPTTRGALAALTPDNAIDELRLAREVYEDVKYGKASRIAKGQWQGLLNRWNKAHAQAKAFQKEQGGTFPIGTTIVVGTGGGAAAVSYTFWDWITSHIVPSVIIACGVAAVVVLIIRKIKGD